MITIALLVVVMTAACTATALPAVVDHTVAGTEAGVVVMRKLMQDANKSDTNLPENATMEESVVPAGEGVVQPDSSGLFVSDGSARKPYCSWEMNCVWNDTIKAECAQKLCERSGYTNGTFVDSYRSTGMCPPGNPSIVSGRFHYWTITSKRYMSGDFNREARITARCFAPSPPPPSPPPAPPPNVGDAIKNATDAVKDTIDKAKDAAGAAGNAAGAAGDVPKTGVADLKDESVTVTLGSSARVYHSLVACVGTLMLWALAA
ncbi:hypothetical protein RI054_03g16750 [Pseudoscourfieldia marina]